MSDAAASHRAPVAGAERAAPCADPTSCCACFSRSRCVALDRCAWESMSPRNAIPPYILPAPSADVRDAGQRLGGALGLAAGDVDDHAAGPGARGGRRRGARGPVEPVAAGRILALSVRGDPAGHADRGDRAAAADLSAAALAVLACAWIVAFFPVLVQHDARPAIGRPQPASTCSTSTAPRRWQTAVRTSSCPPRCPTSSAA